MIRPRSDTCQVCDSFEVKLDAAQGKQAKTQLQGEWDLHKARAQNAYHHQLKEDTLYAKSNPHVLLLSFDLQQTLPTPQLTTKFYKRQLWTYNLGIHTGGTDEHFAYMWHEGIAARGSTEIGS